MRMRMGMGGCLMREGELWGSELSVAAGKRAILQMHTKMLLQSEFLRAG